MQALASADAKSPADKGSKPEKKWYIVHAYSNFERKVADSIREKAHAAGLDDAFEEIHSRIKTIRVGADDPPPLIQLRANLSGAITYLLRDRPMTSILLHHAVGLDPIIDKKVVAFESRLLALIETALAYGQEIGLVRPCEPHVVGLCALGMIKEVVRSVSASREWEAQLDPLVDEILTMGLKGLLFQTPRRERKRAQEPKKVGLRLVKT